MPKSGKQPLRSGKQPQGDRPGGHSYLKYSGMAVQMAVTILVSALLGQWLDGYFATGNILTIVLTLFGVFAGMYVALKDFL